MASSVFFKFKSQREPSRVEFDGTGISVFELKRDIIVKSGLGDGTEFDLAIYTEDESSEYTDDLEIIPRSTLVIARRLPPIKPGAGRAARYVSGKAPVNAKNAARKEQPLKSAAAKAAPTSTTQMDNSMTEEERMAAMFQQQSELWSAQQEEMSHQTPVFRPGGKKPTPANVPDHEPPLGYVCFRCGQKGHWIQVCPTNDDPAYDNKPRVKRTTGIPRSFLKTVAKPTATEDGEEVKPPTGVMVNADGEFVIAEPDKASWEQYQAKAQSSVAAQKAADLGEKELQERGLECPIDKRMFIDPMKTPCCEKTYCNECITNALIESDFTCPGCQTDGVLIDDLKPDEAMVIKAKEYIEEKNSRKEKERSKSPATTEDNTEGTETKEAKAASPTVASKEEEKQEEKSNVSPKSSTSTPAPTETASKKRPADELLENPKIPKGPKAMQQQQQQQQQNLMGSMPGFPMMPNMPFDMMNQFGMGMNPMMFGMPMPNMGGFPGMPNMPGFPMPNGGMGFTPGMFNNGMGFPGGPGMGNMGMMNGNGNGGGRGQGMAMSMGMNMGGGMGGNNGGYPTQPKNFQPQGQGQVQGQQNEEDSPYFRQPVNPHRHQGRQRRVRPSDYREL